MRVQRVGAMLLLVSAGCATFFREEVHPALGEVYGPAQVVFIAPFTASVCALTGLGVCEHREDGSRRWQERLGDGLRTAFEKRGLAVVGLAALPGNDVLLEEVRRRFETTLPAFRAAVSKREQDVLSSQAFPRYSLGEVGLLHQAAGADLVVLVEASATVQTTEGVITDVFAGALLSSIGIETSGPPGSTTSICIAVVDRSGRILYFQEGWSIDTVLDGLPRRR